MTSAGRDSQSLVDDLLDTLVRSDGDPTLLVVDDCAAVADAALAAVIPRAAIPRRLDARVLGVLAGDSDAGPTLLAGIFALPFTQAHPAGGWRYHDRTRDALLKRWRTSERMAEFGRLSSALAADHEQRLNAASELVREITAAAPALAAANPQRLAAIRLEVDNRQLISFREAAYHWRNVSAAEFGEFLRRTSPLTESSARLADIAVAQIRRALGAPDKAPTVADAGAAAGTTALDKARLRYWELSIQLSQEVKHTVDYAPQWERLGSELAHLSPSADVAQLQAWVQARFTMYLLAAERNGEAVATNTRELELAARTGADPWELPNAYWRLTSVRRQLGDLPAAIDASRRTADAADAAGNQQLALVARLEELDLLHVTGSIDAARVAGAHALHLSWTLPGRINAGSATGDVLDAVNPVLRAYMQLVADEDTRLTDSVVAQTSALVPRVGADVSAADVGLWHASVLRRRGALDRALVITDTTGALIAAIGDRAAAHYLTQWRGVLRAAILAGMGRREETEAELAALLSRTDDRDSGAAAVAWLNRADNLAELHRWDDAMHAANRAHTMLMHLGDSFYAAGAQAVRARVLIARGELDSGRRLLAKISAELDDKSEVGDAVLAARADAASAGDDWQAAGALHRRRALYAAGRGDLLGCAGAHSAAATAFLGGGHWAFAGEALGAAGEATRRLALSQSAAPSTEQRAADRQLAAATQRFFDGAGDRLEDVAEACDELAGARADDPGNTWILLAQFYANLEIGRWGDAGLALAEIDKRRPVWLAAEWITQRTQEFEAAHGSLKRVRTDGAFAAAARRTVARWTRPGAEP